MTQQKDLEKEEIERAQQNQRLCERLGLTERIQEIYKRQIEEYERFHPYRSADRKVEE